MKEATVSTVLITGSNGFVGQHLIRELNNNYKIIGLIQTPIEGQVTKNVEYHEGDINDSKFFYKILDRYQPDYIIHLAARAQSWSSDANSIFETNVMGTINLYEQIMKIRNKKIYNPKIIYVSSAEIYGHTNLPNGIKESDECHPVSLYAASKLSADGLSYAYSQSQKLNILIARPFPHTGPGQGLGFFVTDMISQIVEIEMSKKKDLLTGNLSAIRDYLDVRDVVRAYRLLLELDIVSGSIFNICSGEGIKMEELLGLILKHSKIGIKTTLDKKRLRPSDVPIFVGDNSKLINQTGWSRKIGIDKTIEDTFDYWRDKLSKNT